MSSPPINCNPLASSATSIYDTPPNNRVQSSATNRRIKNNFSLTKNIQCNNKRQLGQHTDFSKDSSYIESGYKIQICNKAPQNNHTDELKKPESSSDSNYFYSSMLIDIDFHLYKSLNSLKTVRENSKAAEKQISVILDTIINHPSNKSLKNILIATIKKNYCSITLQKYLQENKPTNILQQADDSVIASSITAEDDFIFSAEQILADQNNTICSVTILIIEISKLGLISEKVFQEIYEIALSYKLL